MHPLLSPLPLPVAFVLKVTTWVIGETLSNENNANCGESFMSKQLQTQNKYKRVFEHREVSPVADKLQGFFSSFERV